MGKISYLVILIMISNKSLSNEIEKNKILNIMVKTHFDEFSANKGDVIQYYDYPFTFNLPEESKVAANSKELIKLFKKHSKKLKKNYLRNDWKKMDVKLLSENIAIANGMFSRIDNSGNNYHTGTAMYWFRKKDNEWKIFSITPFKPYNYFDFD